MAGGYDKGQNQPTDKTNDYKEKIKKFLLRLFFVNIPIIIFVVIPLITRNYYIKTLKISEDIFFAAPEEINLVKVEDEKTEKVGPCYKFNINGYTFSIPEKFVPSKLSYDTAEFRVKSVSEGRYIYIQAKKITKAINTSFLTKLFLPTEMRYLLPVILSANWHPYRLMFKAHLYSNEGINTKIFKAVWGDNHIGFIFPAPGNEGYFGRIYRMDGDGTVELLIKDSVKHITLRDWVNIAMMMEVPSSKSKNDTIASGAYILDNIIDQAYDDNKQPQILSIALNQFYCNKKKPEWLIPVGIIMGKRGFIPELFDLINKYKPKTNDKKYFDKWNELIDKSVKSSINIEIDPVSDLRELNLYCKNLTNLDISEIVLNITVISKFGTSQSFEVQLLKQNTLRSKDEKQIQVKCPSDVSLTTAAKINHRVTRLEFLK